MDGLIIQTFKIITPENYHIFIGMNFNIKKNKTV